MSDIANYGLLSQVIAFVISLFFYIKYKTNFLILLTLLLFATVVVEGIGAYSLYINKPSYSYHYFYVIVEFLLISLIYFKLLKNKRLKMLFIILTVSFLFFWIAVDYNKKLYQYLVICEGAIISTYVFLYLRELLMSNKILNYKKLLPFWVSVGFLVFYLPSIPFFALLKHMKDRELFYIIGILIILMNLVIITGLIWSRKDEV